MTRPRAERSDPSETGELRLRSFDSDLRLAVVADIARALSGNLTNDQLVALIMERLTKALDADRSTLFLCSDDGEELWSTVAQGAGGREIRIRRGQGLAGWVAATGRAVNVKDAHQDSRFDPQWDLENDYRTTSMVCQPIFTRDGELVGVVQVLNKNHGYFTVEDEGLLTTIMAMAAISIVNGKLNSTLLWQNVSLTETRQQLADKVGEIDLLYRLERDVGGTQDLGGAVAVLLERIASVVPSAIVQIGLGAGVGMVLHRLARGARQPELMAFETVCGLTGMVLGSGHQCDVADLPPPELTALAQAEQLPFTPQSGLCLPLQNDGTILGALAVFDRPGRNQVLTEDHGKLLTLISSQVARAIAQRQAREQAEREDRLAAVGRALAGAMHDFRTPMTIASGYVQMLKNSDDATERGEMADQILHQLDRMMQMTREVLAFARGDQTVLFRKVMVHEFAREAEELIGQIFAQSGVRTEVVCSYKGPARMDAGKLLRVVQNIARNSREALAGRPDSSFTLRIEEHAGLLVFTFADNGAGVPNAFRHRLFDAFASGGKKDGTGLGLAMVKQFAEAHDGGVSYRESPGGGATFEIRIAREPRSPA